MITINIDNSYSKIGGLDGNQYNKLRKILSYTTDPKASYFSGGFVRVKYLIDKRGNFPTGLLYRVIMHFKEEGYTYTTKDGRKRPKVTPGMFKLNLKHEPYEDQLAAAIYAEEHERCGIVMPTGSGKSLVIALIVSGLNVRTLVIVPTLEIKKQLTASLLEWFGPNKYITVKNIDASDIDGDYDCIIIDEAHHSAARTFQILNKSTWNNIYYRFFLTATFFRNQSNEQLLFEGICGQTAYRLTFKDAVDKGYIVPVESYYFDLPKVPQHGFTWNEVYSELVVNYDVRNAYIVQLLNTLTQQEKYSLCLVKEIAHGEKLSKLSGIPFANGQDEESRKYIDQFNSGRIKALIGTTGILGEGIDTRPTEYVIIAGLGKAKSSFLQQVGRGVRNYPGKESCKVILFRDRSHKFTLSHFNAQKKILFDEMGVKVLKL